MEPKKHPIPFPKSEGEGTPSDLSWLSRREQLVQEAVDSRDMLSLRRISALPGGFGSDEMRRKVWPVLLNTEQFFSLNAETPLAGDDVNDEIEDNETSGTPSALDTDSNGLPDGIEEKNTDSSIPFRHPDEGQVLLDTKRSFVAYPKDLPADNKLEMQADLQNLIVGVLRLYPTLSYFQGYHDIISVLYLTFIPPKPPPRSRTTSRTRSRKSSRISVDEKKAHQSEGDGPKTQSQKLDPVEKEIKLDAEGTDEKVEIRGAEKLSSAGTESVTNVPDQQESTTSGNEADKKHGNIESGRDTPEWRILRQCAEVVSLCRVRDGMGKGLEGVMGLLRILKRVLKAADPELDEFSSSISPVPTLPFFALSWILCLFSHDVDTLEPIQRMFDFLLARNPVSAIYLAVAILVAKKPQMFDLADKLGPEYRDDPSLLHPLFARLPPLQPDNPETPPHSLPSASAVMVEALKQDMDDINPYNPIPLSELFRLTDKLMEDFPWDGDVIKGRDIMGDASVVCSYELEIQSYFGSAGEEKVEMVKHPWGLDDALKLVDGEVIRPGANAVDEEEEEPLPPVRLPIKRRRRQWPIRIPRDKFGTSLAFMVVILGVGIAVYGVKSGGVDSSWKKWWNLVIRSWVDKGGMKNYWKVGLLGDEARRGVFKNFGYVSMAIRDLF